MMSMLDFSERDSIIEGDWNFFKLDKFSSPVALDLKWNFEKASESLKAVDRLMAWIKSEVVVIFCPVYKKKN